jgi:hypothetical protein
VDAGSTALFSNLAIATAMVCATTTLHLIGLIGLVGLARNLMPGFRRRDSIMGQAGVILGIVIGLFLIHSVEIWSYAALYEALGLFETFEAALYFSTVAFTTVGFGDLVIDSHWRLVSAIEAANGFILIGWSTAFLVSITQQVRLLEAEIEEELEERDAPRSLRR